jgi:hypothetical protein
MSRWACYACILQYRLVVHALRRWDSGSNTLPHVRRDYSQWNLHRCVGEQRFPSIVLYIEKESFIEIMLSTGLTTIHRQKKPRIQQSNKAAREDGPSVAGEKLFEIFQRLLRISWRFTGPAPGTQEQSLPQVREDVTLNVGQAVFHARRGSTSLQHGHTRTPEHRFLSAVVFRRARSFDINFLNFLVWGPCRCLVYGAPAVTGDYLQARIQTPCDNIHKHVVSLNDSDSQPSYRPETFNIVTKRQKKPGKITEETSGCVRT